MTSLQYASARTLRGSQSQVARLLGVTVGCVSRRECGRIPITQEAELALLALPKLRKK